MLKCHEVQKRWNSSGSVKVREQIKFIDDMLDIKYLTMNDKKKLNRHKERLYQELKHMLKT